MYHQRGYDDARKFTANAPKYFSLSFLYKLNGNLNTETFKDLNNNLNLSIHNNQDVTFKLTTGETYCCITEQLYRKVHEKRQCLLILCLNCGNFFRRRHNFNILSKKKLITHLFIIIITLYYYYFKSFYFIFLFNYIKKLDSENCIIIISNFLKINTFNEA